MSQADNLFSIIIPTYNESENISVIIERIKKTLCATGREFEILVVDDNSPDNTSRIAQLALGKYGRVINRKGPRGLSLSVLDGIKEAKGDAILVIDADGSHPPEVIPDLIKAIEEGSDLAVASRYCKGGGFKDYPISRRIISGIACLLGRLVTSIKDNTSGFFCVKRDALKGTKIIPQGFKIGLEIFVKAACSKIVEVPYIFIDRQKGKSKLSRRQVGQYLMQLSRLLLFKASHFKLPLFCFFYLFIMFSALSSARHFSLSSSSFDLGIFDQAIWNTLQGNPLFSSLRNNMSLLGDHFEPILFLIVPLYKIWPDVRVLFVLQSFLLASAVFPLYLIGRLYLKERFLIYAFLISYMFSRPLRGVALSDFHPECFILPLLLWAYYFLVKQRRLLFFLSIFLLALCKEDVAFIISALGIFAFFVRKQRALGTFLFILGPLLWVFETKFVIASFNPQGIYPYMNRLPFGQTYADNIKAIISHPGLLSGLVVEKAKIEYFFKIFSPLGFLPLLSPGHYILIGIPFLRNLLPQDPNFSGWYNVSSHYTASVIPFVYIAAISGAAWIIGRLKVKRAYVYLGALILILAFAFQGKNDFSKLRKFNKTIKQHRTYERLAYLKNVPDGVSVAANFNLVPHLSHRKYVFDWSPVNKISRTAEYLVIDLKLVEYIPKEDMDKFGLYIDEIKAIGYAKVFENADRNFYIYRNTRFNPDLIKSNQ